MKEDRLYDDPGLAQFYDLENRWGPDFDFCARLAGGAASLLDLGCGTGRLAARLAEGREVVGVDPAAAMLDLARAREGGDRVTWIEADARDLDLGRRFDLVLLTGHAFQVFLTEDDQLAVLKTIAGHLAPGGRFVFDSRNPAAEEWREWMPALSQRTIEHPTLGPVEAWNDASHDAASGIVTYETHYRIERDGRQFTAASRIKFTPREQLESLLDRAGLAVERWFGDWQGGDFNPTSGEIIPLGHHP